ncbi:extracellular solute-binding protein [Actinacidiphila alni]|uniref:extracellular solute-binding protein n=1 Tax=Actinacidiphila alni TaxID=380248 RepID=UPI0033E6118F
MTRVGGARRRIAATAASLCLLALAPAACTGGGADHAPQPTTSGGGEIVVASGLDVTGTDGVRQQLIQQWNSTPVGKQHPARLVELPGSADQQRSQLLGALQSGSSAYDVVNLDVTWVPEFAQAGLISPLDRRPELDDADVIPSVAATARWKGHTYAAPFNSDVGLLYYRVDSLKDVGIDPSSYPGKATTWPQLQSLIRAVGEAPASDRPAGYQAGWTSQLDAYEGLTVNAVEAFESKGVRLTDADGRYTATAAGLRKGLTELKTRAGNDYTLPAALSSREAQSLSDFAAGRTDFLRHWPYAYGALSQTLDASRLAVAPLPGKAVLGGQDLAVSAGSPRARYALDLIAYLTRAESERCLLDAGFAATRKSAYTDPAVRCRLAPAAGPSVSAETHDMPRDPDGRPSYAAPILLPALTNAVQRPRTPYYGAFTQLLQSRLHDWLSNPDLTDPDQLADSLDTALAKILKGK